MNGPMQGDTRSAMMRKASVWVSSSAWDCMVRVGKNEKARGARGGRGENETFFRGKIIFIIKNSEGIYSLLSDWEVSFCKT